MKYAWIFVALVAVVGCKSKEPSARYIINSIHNADLDKNKSISRNEFKIYFQGRYSQLDAGDTGKVPAARLCPGVFAKRICEGADLNKDGIITIDELYSRLDVEFARVSGGKGAELSYKEFHQALLP
ncbi:hypothetical protein [Bdellovibrio sp. HCB209]|uniref:hypothetical protein n=1 Tax=Bdellovibrio sp. HCB209 TaxID=3394354 RepID=UPI0039B5CAFF